MTVGDRIRQARLEQDVTQQELADYIGVSKQAVYKYENNIVTNIPTDKVDAIARRLKVSPAYLMGWEEQPTLATPIPPGQESKKAPGAISGEVSDEEIKFALFGGGPVTDAQYEEVKQFVRFIKERDANAGKG